MRCRVAGSARLPSLLACPTIPHTGPSRPQSRQSAVACCAAVRRRIAFIDYFATHYRKRLYEELARRMEVDFYFFADERERYWNRKIPLVREGDFRRVELRRYRVAGEAVMPGLALALHRRRYDAVVKSLNGKLMLPLVYGASRARRLPFVLWTGMWHHPRTALSPRDSAAHAARLPRRRGDRGLWRARRALPRRDGRRRCEQGLRRRAGGRARAVRGGATGAQRRRGGAVRRPVRGAQGSRGPACRLRRCSARSTRACAW